MTKNPPDLVTNTFSLNGEEHTVTANPKRSVLDVLREDLDHRTLKPGCSPQGVCGCCAMMLDGKFRLACTLPFKSIEGKSIQTLDGFPEDDRTLVAEAFTRAGGSQCGYCTPGIAVQTLKLINEVPEPTDEQIGKALNMHICRCTGWTKIYDSIKLAAAMKRGEVSVEFVSGTGVGGNLARNDGHMQVLGQKPYIDDMIRPGMLHGGLVWTPHPRCKILKIDASKALALPGVHAVVTAKDLPENRKVGLIFRDWPIMIAEGEETRCVADVLAAVAADTRELAYAAAALVEVEVEELTPVTDVREAAKDPEALLATSRVQKGDIRAAVAAGELEVVIKDEFEVQVIDQAFLEPEGSLVVPLQGGGLHVYSPGQGVFDDQKQLCELFGMAPEDLTVELVATGGGFGAKEDLNVQPHACALALKTGRPIKISLNMEESTRFHPKRHAMVIRFMLGAKQDGTFTGVKALLLGDTGGYASVGDKVLERAAGHACGPYRVAHVDVEARTLYTNNPVCGAMRGFGVNQVAWALEGCIDRLAEKLERDPLELRYQNALNAGDLFGTGQRINESVGIKQTLDAIRPYYDQAKKDGKHVGVACGVKNVGMGNGLAEVGRVVLEVRSGGEICIKTGFTEMGQGHDTVMRQFATEATGLPEEVFTVECDTRVAVDVGMTTASRATYLGGNAVLAAAPGLLAALDNADADLAALTGQSFSGAWEAPMTHKPDDGPTENPVTHYAYGWATQLAIIDADGKLEEVVAAHDVGRAINPILCEGQVEGGVHMGIGYALSEELVITDGVPDTKFRNLGIIKAKDCPKITTVLVEHPDITGPWGAKGIGEIGLVPTAPAIGAAMHSHDGIWRTKLPMKDTPAGKGVGARIPKKKRK
jgi:selenium-dependent xanthine dehydrogenase